jgi:hypothetical protein
MYPGSVFFPSRTPDPNFIHPETRIRIKEFKYSCRIRIPDPEPDFLPIPDPGVRKAPDPGSGSATLSLYFYLPSVFRITKILIRIRISSSVHGIAAGSGSFSHLVALKNQQKLSLFQSCSSYFLPLVHLHYFFTPYISDSGSGKLPTDCTLLIYCP